jgi:phytoene/squalene synthetase
VIETRRTERAPQVGEALQLTNILLDWPIDLERGRCHLPAEWLARRGLGTSDLGDPGHPGVRDLGLELERLALGALARVPDYLDTVPAEQSRYRLFCLWPALWAIESLRHARRDPRWPVPPRRARLPRATLWRVALGSVLVAHDEEWVREKLAPRG